MDCENTKNTNANSPDSLPLKNLTSLQPAIKKMYLLSMKPMQIQIPKPCHESWDAMADGDKGRFCSSCQKTVIDFTQLSDKQIAAKIQSEQNICGRFNQSQIGRELIEPKQKSAFWTAAVTGVLSLLHCGNDLQAQTKSTTIQTDDKKTQAKIGEIAALPIEKTITGTVTDAKDGIAIPGIHILNLSTKKGVQTDFNGTFEITARVDDTLRFSFLGYEEIKMTVGQSNRINLTMKTDPNVYLEGEVVYTRKRNFFGRMFRHIGSWFR